MVCCAGERLFWWVTKRNCVKCYRRNLCRNFEAQACLAGIVPRRQHTRKKISARGWLEPLIKVIRAAILRNSTQSKSFFREIFTHHFLHVQDQSPRRRFHRAARDAMRRVIRALTWCISTRRSDPWNFNDHVSAARLILIGCEHIIDS